MSNSVEYSHKADKIMCVSNALCQMKKPDAKGYLLTDSTYVTFGKGKSVGMENRSMVTRGLGGVGGGGGLTRDSLREAGG